MSKKASRINWSKCPALPHLPGLAGETDFERAIYPSAGVGCEIEITSLKRGVVLYRFQAGRWYLALENVTKEPVHREFLRTLDDASRIVDAFVKEQA